LPAVPPELFDLFENFRFGNQIAVGSDDFPALLARNDCYRSDFETIVKRRQHWNPAKMPRVVLRKAKPLLSTIVLEVARITIAFLLLSALRRRWLNSILRPTAINLNH
jgi:hypothetical protein